MANSDTTFGVFNKQSQEIKIYNKISDESPTQTVVTQSFGGNVETAKSFFFTDDALACFNTNVTQLAWAITDDGNGIKFTMAFGIPSNPAATPWADAYNSTKSALKDANNWIKSASYNADTQGWTSESVDSHLF
jgi:hypothetical protein